MADPAPKDTALPARPDLPVEDVVTNPHWTQLPDADTLSNNYPPLAQLLGLSGSARISCTVTQSGTLVDCSTLWESPAGFGFGLAAVQMSSAFKMAPRTVDGGAVSGAKVLIPIRFKYPGREDQTPKPVPATTPPSPRVLALARRLAAKSGDDSQVRQFKSYVEKLRTNLEPSETSAQQKLAIDAYEQAVNAAIAKRSERHAEALARSMSEKDINAALAFLSRPAGQRWLAGISANQLSDIEDAAALQDLVTTDARARLCAKIACSVSSSPPPTKN
jgi:protein TonB